MILGIVTAYWNGTQVPLEEGSTIDIGGLTSEPRVVGSGVDFSNSIKPSAVKLKVAVQKGMNVTGTFAAGVVGELQVQADTGQSWTWVDAFRSGTIPITAGSSGGAEVSFGGGAPLEQVIQ